MQKYINCVTSYTRSIVQILFIFISIILCVKFAAYVDFIKNPAIEIPVPRPPGVEAYLPISSLMSVLYWLKTGIVQTVRPAGMVLFLAFIAISFFLRRGFCSWICPIGALSELIYKAREKWLQSTVRLHWYIDFQLKALKYVVLGFFLFFLLPMRPAALEKFINGSYNAITDIRMYDFFGHIGPTGIKVFFFLFIMSFALRNFWCRNLCPYGALLGICGILSPMAVARNEQKCVSCGKCSKICPNGLMVEKKERVFSSECTGCYMCIDDCPVDGALEMKIVGYKKPITKTVYAALILGLFLLITRGAMAAGYWDTSRTPEKIKSIYHSGGEVAHPSISNPGGESHRDGAYH